MRLFRRIQEHVINSPEMAVLSALGEDKDISFRELDRISGKVCRYLHDHGIGLEDFVNILLPRGVEPFIAMLGVWKAGAAFVLLEEGYPAERTAFIQKDCGAKLILDRAAWDEVLQCDPHDGFAEVNEHDTAFAVYTSGTTGTPKGVLHEYGNLDLIMQSLRCDENPLVSSGNHFAMIAPLNFVAAVQAYICVLDIGLNMSIVPYSIVKNPPALVRAFTEAGVDTVFCAPSIYRLFRKIPVLKIFFVGSEPANGIWADDPEIKVINSYNMSETAFSVTIGFLDKPNEIAPVGKPLTEMKITIRDEEGNPVPDGEAGELCVEDPFVRCYINHPEQTAKAFVNGEFHTRDLARKLPDGQYEVIGRIDDMIKISGNRVEPAEIEAAVRRVSGLEQVVARSFGEGEDTAICLYYADPVELNLEEIREKLETILPYYMIPSHFIHMDELPRTATGKISRLLLPKPVEEQTAYAAPENDTERALCDAMASVLELDRFSAEDDFYRMGGSSISSMEVLSVCGLPGLTINQIFRGRTPRKIARYYLSETADTGSSTGNAENLTRPCPLSQAQLGIFLECVKHEGEAVYNNPMLVRLSDDADPDKMADALDRTMRAHPGLFAEIISDEEGLPAMRYQPAYAEQEICIRERMSETELQQKKASLVQPFDITHERLFRIRLIETEAAKYLFLDFHHIIFDGTSMQILIADLEKALNGETVVSESWTAYDAAIAEQNARQSDARKRAREWYLGQFGSLDPGVLPAGDRNGQKTAFGDQRFTLDLSAEEMKAFCEKNGTSENILTLAAFGYLLSSYTLTKDTLFSTVYNGRRDPRTGRTVSMFVTTLPVLCRAKEDIRITDYLAELKEQLLGCMANDIYSFADLASETAVRSDVQFVWQTDLLTLPKGSGLQLTREELPFIATGEAISAELYSSDDRLIFHIQYQANRYSEAYIARFVQCYNQVLKDMITRDKLSEVRLLSNAGQQKVIELSTGAELSYDTDKTWLDLFLSRAEKTPDKTAVTDHSGSYTYAQLNTASDSIAAFLISNSVEENNFVAVKTGRVKEFAAAVLGIHKAGAAYIPIDPDYPEERISYMLQDSEAKIVLTEETILRAIKECRDAEPVNRTAPALRAYMIYTSGSTGKPKGVVQTHRSLRAFTAWRIHELAIGTDSVHAVHASFAFDASLDDLICPLAAGGEIHILSNELRMDMAGMKDYFRRHHVTALTMSTQIGMAMVNQYPDMDLRFIMMGGEKMLPTKKTGIKLINGYGPTEFTVCSSYHIVDQEKDTEIPIGRPVPNTRSFICNAAGKLLPQGAAGELCLAGPQIAEGYWKKKGLTDKAFVPCRFLDGQEARMYRTGDLARYNEDGELEFLGRIDSQVKLRGFRIEPGEIETAASLYEGITLAAAEVCGDQLVLFYTSDSPIDRNALRSRLAESLTEYMIPSAFVQLEEMPMTPNGKIDRKALRGMSAVSDEAMVLPENEMERKVSDLVTDVLSGRQISVISELQREGLSSIAAMRLTALIAKEFRKNIRLSDLKEHGTIRRLAEYLAAEEEEEQFDLRESYPLFSVQQGVYVESLVNPDTTIYNVPSLFRLDNDVDIDRLKEALEKTVNAHPYLKMRLALGENGRMIAVRRDGDPVMITEKAFSDLPHGFPDLVYPYKLPEDSLFRLTIIHDEDAHYLFIDGHHLVLDGESLHIFLQDLVKACEGNVPVKESYTGFEAALSEEKLRQSGHYNEAKAYYAGLLSGVDTECLPVYDRDTGTPEIGNLSIDTTAEKATISGLVKESGVTLNAFWNAAFGLALSRFLYRDDCVYTTVYNGRNDPRLQNSVGMFVHTLPVVCSMDYKESGMAFAGRIGQQLIDSMSNDIYSFAEISREFDVKADIFFIYQGLMAPADVTIGGKKTRPVPLSLDTLKAPLQINVYETENGFRICCEYDSQHYEEWSIRALLKGTAIAFESLISDRKVGEISLISPEERQMLTAANATEKPVEKTDIVTLFKRAAKKDPQKHAVIFENKTLTYQELDALSDRVTAYMQEKGIGAGDVIAILIQRSEYMPVTALGALKTGAAYQPLDPGYPPERLKMMVEDSGAKALIADEGLKDLLPDYAGEVLYTREIINLPESKPAPVTLSPQTLFILLYTSGTTGVPKGVMLTHGNLVNFCQWYRNYYEFTENSTHSAYASFGFDMCMEDLYPALTTGASVCIVPEDMRLNLPALNDYFEKNRVTHVSMTTQMARMFAINMPETKVKHIMGGGEKLVPFKPKGNFRFYNGYGPTECTMASAIFPVEEKTYRVPVGSPPDNYKTYVTGKDGSELPAGAVGELWIAGFGVSKGYLNKPEQTEKAFLRNPFCDAPGFDRVYRTGDIVRRLPDGKIDFIGRKDGQVKIRGFRIELSEVEGVIRNYSGIRDATVQAFDDPSGNGKYIAAYVTADEPVDFSALSDYIKSKKPSYMVPAVFMQLDEIPLTRNQKVNKKLLPLPVRQDEHKGYEEPATPLEKEISGEFAKILGMDHVGVNDSFFDLGGTSITAANVLTFAISRGYRIVYKDVFDNPTPRKLARVIAGQSRSEKTKQTADYDYGSIDRLLAYNSMEHVDEIVSEPAGNVILTGATGFLGIHVLAALLEKTEGKIYCLLRGERTDNGENRLKNLLMYYFGKPCSDLFGTRIFCVYGDISDRESLLVFDDVEADMIINCAACVKHFVKDDLLDRVNYHGVENLIEVCLKNNMKLVHISTLSVGGSMPENRAGMIYENMLYIGQHLDNDYIRTKFLVERAILAARVEKNLNAVILRAGNLMGRYSDGEFQINFSTNAFMRSLRAFRQLGACPITALEQQVEFSPIDATADTVLKLAGVDRKFSVFHINNSHLVSMADVVFAMKRYGFDIRIVSRAEFDRIMQAAAKDEAESETVMSLLAYETGGNEKLEAVISNNRFTTNALYHLNYKWPIIDDAYLEKLIAGIDELSFFDDLQEP